MSRIAIPPQRQTERDGREDRAERDEVHAQLVFFLLGDDPLRQVVEDTDELARVLGAAVAPAGDPGDGAQRWFVDVEEAAGRSAAEAARTEAAEAGPELRAGGV